MNGRAGHARLGAGSAVEESQHRWVVPAIAAIISILLEIPQCLEALTSLARDEHSQRLVQNTIAGIQVAAATLAAASLLWFTRRRLFGLYARLRYQHLRCPNPESTHPYYAELITLHVPMLRINEAEVAEALRVSKSLAFYILHAPWFVPRPELLEPLCGTLLVPPDWLKTGGDYGETFTRLRLARFQRLGVARIWTDAKIAQAPHDARRTALQRLEKELRGEFALSTKKRGRDG